MDVAGDDPALHARAEPGSWDVDWIRCGWSHERVLCAGNLVRRTSNNTHGRTALSKSLGSPQAPLRRERFDCSMTATAHMDSRHADHLATEPYDTLSHLDHHTRAQAVP